MVQRGARRDGGECRVAAGSGAGRGRASKGGRQCLQHLGVHGRVAVARDAQGRLAEQAVTDEALEERLEQDLEEEAVDGDDGEEVAEAARVGAPGVEVQRAGVQQGCEHTEEGEHDADENRGGQHEEKVEGV